MLFKLRARLCVCCNLINAFQFELKVHTLLLHASMKLNGVVPQILRRDRPPRFSMTRHKFYFQASVSLCKVANGYLLDLLPNPPTLIFWIFWGGISPTIYQPYSVATRTISKKLFPKFTRLCNEILVKFGGPSPFSISSFDQCGTSFVGIKDLRLRRRYNKAD